MSVSTQKSLSDSMRSATNVCLKKPDISTYNHIKEQKGGKA